MLSIWEKETFHSPQDIIIVGAGLMGLWTALELKQRRPSLRITILERNHTPSGASTRNAGFACFGSPTELIRNSEIMGTDAMLQLVLLRYKGIEKIRRYFADETIGFDPCGGYECINASYRHWKELDEKIHWLNGLLNGITGSENIFTKAPSLLHTPGLAHFDAVYANPTEAGLHSGQLVQALTTKVQAAGVPILFGCPVNSWEQAADGVTVRSDERSFRAQQLLFCSNAFTQALVPELDIRPARGQVIVTSPIAGLAWKGTFHFDEGFYYWRNLGNRVLLGGARNKAIEEEATTDLAGSLPVRTALESFMKDLLPGHTYTIDHYWSGIMAFTEDGRPLVKAVRPNVWVSVACNGMGVALTPMIAEKAADSMLDAM